MVHYGVQDGRALETRYTQGYIYVQYMKVQDGETLRLTVHPRVHLCMDDKGTGWWKTHDMVHPRVHLCIEDEGGGKLETWYTQGYTCVWYMKVQDGETNETHGTPKSTKQDGGKLRDSTPKGTFALRLTSSIQAYGHDGTLVTTAHKSSSALLKKEKKIQFDMMFVIEYLK